MHPLIDIGVNLTSSAFRKDINQVVARAKAAGVDQMILIGSNLADSQDALTLASQYPDSYCTAGIHPHHAADFDCNTLATIKALCESPYVKAIGETGLDFNRNYSTPEQQEIAFVEQVSLACQLQKPLFLHQRDAHRRFYEILQAEQPHLPPAIAHCFTGTKDELFAYLDLGLYIGITGWICDERRGLHLHELVANIPLDRLMLETDAPYLTPRTLKPKPKSNRNEPCYLLEVLKTVAQCRDMSVEELAAATTANAQEFFKL